MIKKKIFVIFIVLIAIAISIYFHLPTKAMYKLFPLFLKYRYGIHTEVKNISEGLRDNIILNNVKISKGETNIKCTEIVTNIRFQDILFPNRGINYNIYIRSPRILLGDTKSGINGIPGMSLWLNTSIFVSDARVSFDASMNDYPLDFSGRVDIENNNIRFNNFKISLGELELEIEGIIDSNKQLNLSSRFMNSENSFLIKGSLDKPQVHTYWGGLDTLFQIEEIKYDNGQLKIPRIKGNVYIEDFQPIDLEGGLIIDKEFIKFDDMRILQAARVNGAINKDRPSRINFRLDNIEGKRLVSKLPAILKILIQSHEVDADINIYGMMDNIQAGGTIKLLSTPMEIACRYRKNKYSFRTIGNGIFKISGSIKWDKIVSVNIKGLFNHMDIKEFIAFLGKNINKDWEGIIDGEFSIKGELKTPIIESKLEVENAELGSIKFDIAYLNLQGASSGPIYLEHSMVYYQEIPAELSGYIDPKGDDIFKDIEIKPSGDSFIWEGVNVIRDAEGKIVTFGKEVDKNINVRFKSGLANDSEEEDEQEKPEVELEYKILDDKNLLLKMQEDEGTVGVEHKVKF